MSEEFEEERIFTINEMTLEKFDRLDRFLTKVNKDLSRSTVKSLFQREMITGSNPLKLNRLPPIGTVITIQIPPPIPTVAQPEDIPLDIIYEDEHLLIVNKEAGMVTHPAPGNYNGTLVNAVLHHCHDLKQIGDQVRPGIVHRLDKGTSGVMVVAKNQQCHEGLVILFSSHDIIRRYHALALVNREIPIGGTMRSTLGRHPQNRLKMAVNVRDGKTAVTHFKVLEQYKKCHHMELTLETGRTHQIRVHLSSLMNTPILMDPVYGNPKQQLLHFDDKMGEILGDYPHPLLHAKVLGFVHPITKEELYFETELPPIFQKTLEHLKSIDE